MNIKSRKACYVWKLLIFCLILKSVVLKCKQTWPFLHHKGKQTKQFLQYSLIFFSNKDFKSNVAVNLKYSNIGSFLLQCSSFVRLSFSIVTTWDLVECAKAQKNVFWILDPQKPKPGFGLGLAFSKSIFLSWFWRFLNPNDLFQLAL